MSDGISPNARRWLNTIAFAEGTWGDGAPRYDITFGYQPIKDLSRHPDRVVHGNGYSSAAAGAYQFMPATWERAQRALGLKNFGPQSQDQAALQLLRWRGVDPDRDPITRETVAKVAGEWASLPTLEGRSAYGQPVKSFEALQKFAAGQGEVQTADASQAPAQPADAETETLSQILLSKYIDALSKKSKPDLGPGLKAPALPDYSEDSAGDTGDELSILLNAYKNSEIQKELESSLQNKNFIELNKNLAASESAKSQLLAQALSAFGAPESVI